MPTATMKTLKVVLITFASLLMILLVAVSIALWFVFTPDKLTPMVQKQADKYLTCKSEIGSVELTFFSTYPNFGLKINHFALIHPVPGIPNDTLVGLDELVGIVDLAAWWKRDEIQIKQVILNHGTLNLFYDSLGHANYEIFPTDTTASESEPSAPFVADLENIRFKNVNVTYIDRSMPMAATLDGLTGSMKGTFSSDLLHSHLEIDESVVSFEYGGEKYLQQVSTHFDLLFDLWLSHLKMNFTKASGTLNELPIDLKGSFAEDSITKDLIFDLAIGITESPIEKILTMIPPSYQSYFEGISVTGLLTTEMTMKGPMSATVMPLFNIHLKMDEGHLKYEGVPLAFHDVSGDVTLVTDALSDSLTYVSIDRIEAKTDHSSFKMKGKVNQLFSDLYCNLVADADLTLDEFNSMIPADMKMNLTGKAVGQIQSSFTLSQLEQMQLDKIKMTGNVSLSDFNAKYDSLWVTTTQSKVTFALPNKKPQSIHTRFLSANITSADLKTGMIDSYQAHLGKTILAIEMSNVMDSTRIPNLICSFTLDSLIGGMDTLSVAISKPHGKMTLAPRTGFSTQPQMQVVCSTEGLKARMGKDSASIKRFNIDADVINDPTQKDLFLQWLVKGFVNMEQGHVALSALTCPLEIPSIQMEFDTENFNIKKSQLIVGRSDFQLVGNLTNILSYFRGDSILKGNFNFTSTHTDVNQLMALTNGIGNEKPDSVVADTSYTGPYMVPKGMDINLSTNIKQVSFGTGTASDIKGDVRVKDGILLLDKLKLTTPATRIQLTALYRTPRKNHLFLGIDYHMLDVEIEELLTMVPDIDSLMPMLRSFRGKGEFHMAAETYLDSMYNMKRSTLRGAAAITGTDLVLMDGQTFGEIAKTLRFNRKTENRVDSLSAEFTIFKNEIDVYPFLIVMDKYKAVVAGRHNFDMSFDYHISVVDCPLPIKLGIDVKGNIDNLSYRPAKCRYADYYRPTSRNVVANKQLELRKMIREALMEKLKTE